MKNKLIPTIVLAFSMIFITLPASAEVPEGWTSDFEAARETASAEAKPLLLMFTGSDWCVWCKRMHREILDTKTFRQWAADNLLLVYVDFPRQDYRSREVIRQNKKLDERYGVSGYPTLVLVDDTGRELGRFSYMEGGPKTFIRALERAIKKS